MWKWVKSSSSVRWMKFFSSNLFSGRCWASGIIFNIYGAWCWSLLQAVMLFSVGDFAWGVWHVQEWIAATGSCRSRGEQGLFLGCAKFNLAWSPRGSWMTEARGPNPETSSRPCTLSEIQTQNLGRKLSSCFYVNSPECACKGCVETKVLLDHPQLYIVWQHVGLFLFPVEDGALPCRRKRHFLLLHMKSLLLHCQSSCRQNSWSF